MTIETGEDLPSNDAVASPPSRPDEPGTAKANLVPAEAPSPTAEETLSWALEHLAGCHQTAFVAERVRAAVIDASISLPGNAADTWCDRLEAAGPSVGLVVSRVARPVGDLMRMVDPRAHLLAWARGAARPGLVALVERAGGKVRVRSAHEDDGHWMDARGLSTLLGAVDPRQPVLAVFAEPSAPLDALRGDEAAGAPPSPFARLRALLRMERGDLWVIMAYAAAVGVMGLATPIAVQALVNTVAFGTLLQPVVVLAFVLLGCLLAMAALSALKFYVVEILKQRLFVRVVADLSHRLPRVRMEALDKRYGPELVNRFFSVLTVQKSAAHLLLDGTGLLLQTGTGMLLLAFYHPVLLAFDAVLVAALALVVFGLGRGGVHTAVYESKTKYRVAAWLQELVRVPTTFKATGGAQWATGRADALAKEYLFARRRHFGIVLRQKIGGLATYAISSTLLLGIGGWLVIDRQLTIGQLVAAELVVGAVVAGFTKLGKLSESYYGLLAGLDKLGLLVDLPVEREGGEVGAAAGLRRGAGGPPARLDLRNVSYRYGSGRLALANVDLSVAPGEKLAVKGPSGSGKSTLLELVFGLRSPSGGIILFDGVDQRDLSLTALRQDILLVQGAEIVEGTIGENVRLGRTGATPAEIREALHQVGLLDHVLSLPDGLNTRLSAGGSPLSNGQARRLTLARAIVARPRLLLLSEALDFFDDEERERLVDVLIRGGHPWTILVITSREQVLRACDRVVELHQGRLLAPLDGPANGTRSPREAGGLV